VPGPARELQDLVRLRASKLGVVCVNWQQICLSLIGLGSWWCTSWFVGHQPTLTMKLDPSGHAIGRADEHELAGPPSARYRTVSLW